MLSCSIWFYAPSFWMGGGLESRCVCRVYGADGAVRRQHHPHRTRDPRSGSQDHHPSQNSVQKTLRFNLTSNAPDDGRMYPKHVELRIHQQNHLVASSWHFTLFHEEDVRTNNPHISLGPQYTEDFRYKRSPSPPLFIPARKLLFLTCTLLMIPYVRKKLPSIKH